MQRRRAGKRDMDRALCLEPRQVAAELNHVAKTIFLPEQQRLARKRFASPSRTLQQGLRLVMNESRLVITGVVKPPSLFEFTHAEQQRCKADFRIVIVGADRECSPESCLGVGQLTEFLQHVAKVVVPLGEIGTKSKRSPVSRS